MSDAVDRGERRPRADASSLVGDHRSTVRRRRIGRVFAWLTFIPVILALVLITSLFADVAFDAVSWQVVEPDNSGRTFAWAQGFRPAGTWRNVVSLELAAQGRSVEEIGALFDDPEALRRFAARNRVELMWHTDQGPFRWTVTNARDDLIADYGLFDGIGRAEELRASLEPGQRLYLNPWLDLSFFGKTASRTPTMAGIRTALAGSIWVIALVLAISLPLGIGAALYLEEYASDTRINRLIEVNIRNLAGVPSIVYGILGLYVFVRLLRFGPTVLAAAATLSLLILPVVVISAREAVRSVPSSLRQAAYGLGATKWQVVSRVVLPNAASGIATGVILSAARAIGETAPLLLVGAAAFIAFAPNGPLSQYTVMPVQIYSWVSENNPEFSHVASAAIIVLLVVLVVLYGLANFVRRRFERKW